MLEGLKRRFAQLPQQSQYAHSKFNDEDNSWGNHSRDSPRFSHVAQYRAVVVVFFTFHKIGRGAAVVMPAEARHRTCDLPYR
jgi:hypothetical protein